MTPRLIAHRGLRNEAPENTMPAISEALRLPGISGVEFDVELSTEPVVLHQETVVPSDDFRKLVPATRNFTTRNWVLERSAAEIAALDAGSWFDEKFKDVHPPLLSQVLGLGWNGVVPCVELKDPTYWGTRDLTWPDRIVAAVKEQLSAFSGSLNVISFNPEILARCAPLFDAQNAASGSRFRTSTLALWTEWAHRAEEAVALAKAVGASSVSLPHPVLLDDPSWIRIAHDSGIEVHTYPVSPAIGEPEYETWTAELQHPAWDRLASIGVDAILTDFPRETVEFFRKR